MLEIGDYAATLGLPLGVFLLFIIWSFVWKGIALWKSARENSLTWFIILLLINTFGILEILYIFLFSKINLEEVEKIKKKPSKIKKATKKKTTKKKNK